MESIDDFSLDLTTEIRRIALDLNDWLVQLVNGHANALVDGLVYLVVVVNLASVDVSEVAQS